MRVTSALVIGFGPLSGWPSPLGTDLNVRRGAKYGPALSAIEQSQDSISTACWLLLSSSQLSQRDGFDFRK